MNVCSSPVFFFPVSGIFSFFLFLGYEMEFPRSRLFYFAAFERLLRMDS
jgi:hypothetical protein